MDRFFTLRKILLAADHEMNKSYCYLNSVNLCIEIQKRRLAKHASRCYLEKVLIQESIYQTSWKLAYFNQSTVQPINTLHT